MRRPDLGYIYDAIRDQATARKSELMADKQWQDRYLKGDIQARREMRALNVIITGDDGSTYAA